MNKPLASFKMNLTLLNETFGGNLTCSAATDAFEMRKICVEMTNPPPECFPKVVPPGMSNFVGVWCAMNAIMGTCGNLLTLVAIPYAIKHRR